MEELDFNFRDGLHVDEHGVKRWYKNGLLHRDLINYMKANNFTLAHLLTDPDPLVRKSVEEYEWKEVE
jgi:hypothetical protein